MTKLYRGCREILLLFVEEARRVWIDCLTSFALINSKILLETVPFYVLSMSNIPRDSKEKSFEIATAYTKPTHKHSGGFPRL